MSVSELTPLMFLVFFKSQRYLNYNGDNNRTFGLMKCLINICISFSCGNDIICSDYNHFKWQNMIQEIFPKLVLVLTISKHNKLLIVNSMSFLF